MQTFESADIQMVRSEFGLKKHEAAGGGGTVVWGVCSSLTLGTIVTC